MDDFTDFESLYKHLEENGNNKKLQFEASPKVVDKRSTSQNMPFWERKRSYSVILS